MISTAEPPELQTATTQAEERYIMSKDGSQLPSQLPTDRASRMRYQYEKVLLGEVWNGGNYDAVTLVLDENFRDLRPMPEFGDNRDGHKKMAATWHSIFPDMRFAVHDAFISGDVLVARYSASGTHQGTFMGIQATGAHVSLSGTDWCTFKGDKIIEWDHREDIDGLIDQINIAAQTTPVQADDSDAHTEQGATSQ